MKKLLLMLAVLTAFTSCKFSQHKQTKLHSYIATDDDGIYYWYLFYGQNDTYYSYSSRVPVTDFIDITWEVSDRIPAQIATAKELPVTELEDTAVEETASDAVDASPEASADADSGSDGGSGDSSGGDGGGDGGD